MITALLLFFLQAVVSAPSALVVRASGQTQSVPLTTARGASAISAVKLAAALGGSVHSEGHGQYTLTVGTSHFAITDGLPFVRVDSVVVPVTVPPTVTDGTLYLPFQLVSELIPRFVTGFIYDAERGEMRSFDTTATQAPSVKPTVARSPSAVRDATNVRAHKREQHLVVVDAGHGGVDGGMSGPIGKGPKIHEKNITLAVAKLVAKSLRAQGVDVLMTRTTDTLIALSDRGRIANRNHGDVFVSIHVNATGDRGPGGAHDRGYETYFLAEAKTEDAKRVERMENEAVKFETGVNAPKGDPLNFIINDMAQNEHLRESAELAQIIQNGFKSFHPGPNRGVQQANFAVLRGSFMPAVLVEIGFGTNPSEAAYISDTDNQVTIAKSIAHSVIEYLDRYDARVGAGK